MCLPLDELREHTAGHRRVDEDLALDRVALAGVAHEPDALRPQLGNRLLQVVESPNRKNAIAIPAAAASFRSLTPVP